MQLLEHTQECQPKYDLWPYKRWNTGGSSAKNYRCVDLTMMMHICTKFERNPSRNVACRAHTTFPPKYDLWPYKRWNTGGSITKNYRCVDFTKIHLHTEFERIRQEMQLLERTQEYEPKYDLWPYKKWNTEGSITKNYNNNNNNNGHLNRRSSQKVSQRLTKRQYNRAWMHTIIKSIYNTTIYNINYNFLKKCVLRWFLNVATDGASLIDEGKSFHTFGA